MERVVFTVEALRCHQCQRPLHPQEPFYRRQLKTAVEIGARSGEVSRYELVNLCAQCEQFFVEIENEERNRTWWRRFWILAVLVSLFVPYAVLGMYPAIIGRLAWKWWAKRRQKSGLDQADQRRVSRETDTSDAATELTKGRSA